MTPVPHRTELAELAASAADDPREAKAEVTRPAELWDRGPDIARAASVCQRFVDF